MSSTDKESIAIVWFKRDLRIHDHEPLTLAAGLQSTGIKVLPLYIVEPDYWALPDSSARHWRFISQSLLELNQAISILGQTLVIEHKDAVDVFEELANNFDIKALYSHQESGNLWTYQRDKDIGIWCIKNKIKWHESEAYGVFRRFNERDYWAHYWESFMERRKSIAPQSLVPLETHINAFSLPVLALPLLEADENEHIQFGGRSQALVCFNSFIEERGKSYSYNMSSPLTAFTGCSRISPHISFGAISLREVVQKLRKHLKKNLN